MKASAATWRVLAAPIALHCGPVDGRIIFDDLGVAFRLDRWSNQPVPRLILHTGGPTAKAAPLELHETYIRGNDLVATFARTPPHQIAPTVYWRAREVPALSAVAVEMILSMQTDLLDSDPQATVTSTAVGAEFYYTDSLTNKPEALNEQAYARDRSAENLFLMRSDRHNLSYAEMVHPSDFVSAEIFYGEQERPNGIESTLFPERLEKGVIRRARICGWFMPAENDLETAVELAKRFVDEPLPLTA